MSLKDPWDITNHEDSYTKEVRSYEQGRLGSCDGNMNLAAWQHGYFDKMEIDRREEEAKRERIWNNSL